MYSLCYFCKTKHLFNIQVNVLLSVILIPIKVIINAYNLVDNLDVFIRNLRNSKANPTCPSTFTLHSFRNLRIRIFDIIRPCFYLKIKNVESNPSLKTLNGITFNYAQ